MVPFPVDRTINGQRNRFSQKQCSKKQLSRKTVFQKTVLQKQFSDDFFQNDNFSQNGLIDGRFPKPIFSQNLFFP